MLCDWWVYQSHVFSAIIFGFFLNQNQLRISWNDSNARIKSSEIWLSIWTSIQRVSNLKTRINNQWMAHGSAIFWWLESSTWFRVPTERWLSFGTTGLLQLVRVNQFHIGNQTNDGWSEDTNYWFSELRAQINLNNPWVINYDQYLTYRGVASLINDLLTRLKSFDHKLFTHETLVNHGGYGGRKADYWIKLSGGTHSIYISWMKFNGLLKKS